jgi:ribosomal protein S18 acetylase RimI-like enzyme
MSISKKLLLVTFALFSLYIPGITLTNEKPNHKTKKEYSISQFDPERDTQSIANLFKKEEQWLGQPHGSHEQYILSCHNVPNCHIKVLHENNEFAGFIQYDSNAKLINYLAVDNNFRNRGYGEALLKDSIKDLNNKGIHPIIRVLTTPDNIPALNLYEKVGFKRYKGTSSLSYDPTEILESLFDQHAKNYQY